MPTPPATRHRALQLALLAAAAVFLGLHFVHLTADFPNYSPWMDWSKYTDEGWYGDAAIRHFLLGHWYVAGDFNPAAALPAWPFAEALLFRFTGVSLAAARALTVTVFAGILIASWLLTAHYSPRGRASLALCIAPLLLAASPFCFVFTRIAITEPLLVLLTLLALLAAARIQPRQGRPNVSPLRRWISDLLPILALGLLLPLMILTKTTAVFLAPAVFWLIYANAGYRIFPFARLAVPSAALALLLWCLYFFAIVRPHYLVDYRYLFAANAYTGMTRQNFAAVLANMLKDGRWIGTTLYSLALASAVLALARPRRLGAYPLIPALLLWIAGYMAFLAYHNNLQPRYYLVVAVPLTLLLPIVVEDLLWMPYVSHWRRKRKLLALAAVAVVSAAVIIPDAASTIHFVTHPEYTLVQAAEDVAAAIRRDQRTDPTHNPLILSISGSDISLITHLPSICDDFGTLELVDRVKKYNPGWYVAWNQVEDDKLDAMSPNLRLQRVAAFPAMDDPDRNLLILYKLYPAWAFPASPHGTRQPTPRRLRTRLGQQPSVNQLEH
jgi:hypothetical protein